MSLIYDDAHEDDDYAPGDGGPVTIKDVLRSLEQKGCTATHVVLSANREDAFVLIGPNWHRMDLTDSWHPFDPVPGHIIRSDQIENFYHWIEQDRRKQYREGRRFGEDAMRSAIRNLIGAASLVDLDRNNDY